MGAIGRAQDVGGFPATAGALIRVILVGRTGLDARLRFDESLELVRVRGTLDAVGELAHPIDRASSVAVIVAADAAFPPGGDVADFVGALRKVEPRVRILCIRPAGSPPVDGFDGAISPDATAEQFRALLKAPEPRPAAPVPEIEIAQTLEGFLEAAAEAPVGDETLARLVIQGRDPVPPALQLIRKRLGRDDVQFDPGASTAEGRTPVMWRGRALGSLHGAPPEALAPHARWLAAWIVLRDQQAQLRDAAFTDALTGAWNRRYFDRFLATTIEQAQANRRSVTILMFDIDNFKTFNDRHGHAAGDDILRETVRLLRSVIRPTDRVCRIGGDEFAVIFHEPDGPRDPTSRPPESIGQIATRFQKQICAHKFPKLGTEAPGTLSVSGGLATFPWDGRTPEELLARADSLALQSKQQGKNAILLGPGAASVCGTG